MTAYEGKPTLLPQQAAQGPYQRPEPSEEKHFLAAVTLVRQRQEVTRQLRALAEGEDLSLSAKGALLAACHLLEGDDLLATGGQPYTEDVMVKALAPNMRRKLARARGKGRGGWQDSAQCSIVSLHSQLAQHVYKSNLDMLDVANLAGMVWWRLHTIPGDRQRLTEHLQARILLKNVRQ